MKMLVVSRVGTHDSFERENDACLRNKVRSFLAEGRTSCSHFETLRRQLAFPDQKRITILHCCIFFSEEGALRIYLSEGHCGKFPLLVRQFMARDNDLCLAESINTLCL